MAPKSGIRRARATSAAERQAAYRERHLHEVESLDSARLDMIVPVATKRGLERLARSYAVTQRDMLGSSSQMLSGLLLMGCRPLTCAAITATRRGSERGTSDAHQTMTETSVKRCLFRGWHSWSAPKCNWRGIKDGELVVIKGHLLPQLPGRSAPIFDEAQSLRASRP